MKYFDLHCDTLFEAYKQDQALDVNTLDVSFDKAKIYEKYRQVFAVWSEESLSGDDAYRQFLNITERFCGRIGSDNILSVEGGRLLNRDHAARLEKMKAVGVRLLTLVWKDECCVGGAWNTDAGLTVQGKEILDCVFGLGIIPDVAHASDAMIYEVCERAAEAGRPVIDTHTASRYVFDHRRNITDEMFRLIKNTGGIVGITLYPPHINGKETCTVDCVIKHIEHFLSIGAEDNLCIGADLDGTGGMLPDGIKNISHIYKISDRMSQLGYSDGIISKIFFDNAADFFSNN